MLGQLLFMYLLVAIIITDPIPVRLEQYRIVYAFDFPTLIWKTDRTPAMVVSILE